MITSRYNGNMGQIDETKLQLKIESMLPLLNEYQRRMFLSAEAKAIGRGGISLVSRLSGVSRPTLTNGVKELNATEKVEIGVGKSRAPGGGAQACLGASTRNARCIERIS